MNFTKACNLDQTNQIVKESSLEILKFQATQ